MSEDNSFIIRRRPNRKYTVITVISFVGNSAVIFGYFYPLNPSGAPIYFVWLTLGHILFWLGLPRVADILDWIQLFKKEVQKLHRRSK